MKKYSKNNSRVLAIAPAHRGFGYAVIEGKEMLIDWGVKEMRDKRAFYEDKISELINLYQPDVIVTEDALNEASRRCDRVRGLMRIIANLAFERKIEFCRVSKEDVKRFFAKSGANTKHQIAEKIALQFPELDPHLPPKRMPWMSEDGRMSIFEVTALLLFFCRKAM